MSSATNPHHASCLAIIQDTFSPQFGCPRGLLALNGHTFLEEILARLGKVADIDGVVLATSDRPEDDALVEAAQRLGLDCGRGPLDDLLRRIHPLLSSRRPEHVVKVNGNCPLIDPGHIADMIRLHRETQADLTTSECRGSIVRGLGAEIIRAARLEGLLREPLTRFQREFHSQFLKQNPERFRIVESRSPLSRPHCSLAVETPQDHILVTEVVRRLPEGVHERSIVRLLDENPHLVKINARQRGQEVGLEKLLIFPEKVDQILKVANREQELDPSYPISVELSLTSRCQLDCVWCSDRGLRSRENGDLPKATVFRLLEDMGANGARGVVIEGGGEPTLHPDFDEIVTRCTDSGLAAGLITNGVRPLNPEIMRRFDWIRLSLDACNRQEFLELKGKDAFNQVLDNLRSMREHCPTVGVGYVLTNRNFENLERLAFMLQKIEVDYLHIRPVVDHEELRHHSDMSHLADFTYHSFPILLSALEENSSPGNARLPCSAHSLSTVINSTGNVYLCGRLNIHPWFEPVGNINQEDFRAIWTGAARRRQAARLLDPEFCTAHCPQCRMTKYNILLDKQRLIKTRNFI